MDLASAALSFGEAWAEIELDGDGTRPTWVDREAALWIVDNHEPLADMIGFDPRVLLTGLPDDVRSDFLRAVCEACERRWIELEKD